MATLKFNNTRSKIEVNLDVDSFDSSLKKIINNMFETFILQNV